MESLWSRCLRRWHGAGKSDARGRRCDQGAEKSDTDASSDEEADGEPLEPLPAALARGRKE